MPVRPKREPHKGPKGIDSGFWKRLEAQRWRRTLYASRVVSELKAPDTRWAGRTKECDNSGYRKLQPCETVVSRCQTQHTTVRQLLLYAYLRFVQLNSGPLLPLLKNQFLFQRSRSQQQALWRSHQLGMCCITKSSEITKTNSRSQSTGTRDSSAEK